MSTFQNEFSQKYERGVIIETNITSIIIPSQIILQIEDDFIGRLSVLDLSWCLPEGEAEFKKLKVGDRIQCVVLVIDFPHRQVILSRKHLSKPRSETIAWERIERGEEFYDDVNDNRKMQRIKH